MPVNNNHILQQLHICLIENSDVISSRINENQLRDLLIKLVAEGFDAQSQQLQV